MLQHRIEAKWIRCFEHAFALCGVRAGDTVAVLSETQSRPVNVQLAELALLHLASDPVFFAANVCNGPTADVEATIAPAGPSLSEALGGY